MLTVRDTTAVIGLVFCLFIANQAAAEVTPEHPSPAFLRPLLLKPNPLLVSVEVLSPSIDWATITDVKVADFDDDGRNDLAVAWFSTDFQDLIHNSRRMLSIFFGDGAGFRPAQHYDLYIPDAACPAMSVFRFGTSTIGVGDFDGDGDLDLAVLAFFGDEIWFLENRGDGTFEQHLRFLFGVNTAGNFVTPPAAYGVDFDGDGRDELVYLLDPIMQIEQRTIHFWRTEGAIADIYRPDWRSTSDVFVQWTRAMAIGDFDGDGKLDICFTGSVNPPLEDDPMLTVWHSFNPASGLFAAKHIVPSFLCSDVASATLPGHGLPSLILTDLDGTAMECWVNQHSGQIDFALAAQLDGYAGLSPGRGVAAVVADVNGDGNPDLVTKQGVGTIGDARQVEVTLSNGLGTTWWIATPPTLDSTGLCTDPSSQILRPRNLAVADLWGNTLPEIVTGFGHAGAGTPGGGSGGWLHLAIWENSCIGDVNRDGMTSGRDASIVARAMGKTAGAPGFVPDADIDKDGAITTQDLQIVLADLGCVARVPGPIAACAGQLPGDANCDGALNALDIMAFEFGRHAGQTAWNATYGDAGCDYDGALDVNGDGVIDAWDIDMLVLLLTR
jgi:hypothetical protein